MIKSTVNQTSPGMLFLYFLVIFAGVFIVFNLIGIALVGLIYGFNLIMSIARLNFSDPQTVPALYLLQIVTTTLPIFIAPLIFARWLTPNPQEFLKTTIKTPVLLWVIAFFIMLLSSPLIEFLSNLNALLVLPKWLSGLEQWMKDSEENAKRITNAILQMPTLFDCVKNVFLIGFLTAVAEEFLFRGGLQTILLKWIKNPHVAIWVTAAIFSAFHLEFYGFLPRMLLGAIFGYFVYYSGSIWPAVWGHFLNNASAVVVTYLYQNKFITFNPEETNVFNTPGYLLSLIIIINLLLVYKKIALGKTSLQ
ncbi:CPBP family intramembrane glutamic endopeptidase [Mucilaginibacter phyllosphaerae]